MPTSQRVGRYLDLANFWRPVVKTVHLCVFLLAIVALVFAFMGQFKVAVGIGLLSTLIELIASALLGKKHNT